MRTIMSLCIMSAVFIFAGVTYAAGIEVNGDFRVTSGVYFYELTGTGITQLTPRCPCDTGAIGECGGSFRSAIDLGEICYDWASSPIFIVYRYERTVLPTFWVTPGGDAYMPTPGTGILLRSPAGQCYRITVDNIGTLVSSPAVCPEE